jgi:hypothetical protein
MNPCEYPRELTGLFKRLIQTIFQAVLLADFQMRFSPQAPYCRVGASSLAILAAVMCASAPSLRTIARFNLNPAGHGLLMQAVLRVLAKNIEAFRAAPFAWRRS